MRRLIGFALFFALTASSAFPAAKPKGNAAALLRQIRSYIAAQLHAPEANVVVHEVSTYPSPLPGKYTLLPMSSLPKRGGTTTFPLDRNGQRGYFVVQFQLFVPALVVQQDVKGGQPLDGAVAVERMDARQVPWNACTSLSDVSGKQTRFNLQAGSVLIPSELGDIELIHAGDPCTLLVEKGTVEVQAQGQALQAGKKGAMIPVRLADTNKTVYGKVIAGGEVEIDLPEL